MSMVWLATLLLLLRLVSSAGCIGAHGETRSFFPICHAAVAADDVGHADHHSPSAPADNDCPYCGLHHCCDAAALVSPVWASIPQTTLVGLIEEKPIVERLSGTAVRRTTARGPPRLV